MNYPKMDPAKVAALVLEGERHLKFMAGIYRRQHERGKFFLHEHPAGARSWQVPVIKNLRSLRGVDVVRGDQCQYGLTTKGESPEDRRIAMKPTKFMSNSPQMLQQLSKRCDHSHKHQHLVGGRCAERHSIRSH